MFFIERNHGISQVTHKRSLSVGSPFEMIVEAKDIPEADTYIDMAVAEVSRLEKFQIGYQQHRYLMSTEMPV
jgi:thiamine biosynthesis lipoprotein